MLNMRRPKKIPQEIIEFGPPKEENCYPSDDHYTLLYINIHAHYKYLKN